MKHVFICCILTILVHHLCAQSIDRKALVQRHHVRIHKPDSFASLSVGNGRFAYTADITGMQSFPDYYQNGVPLGTQSDWGWHSFPNVDQIRREAALRSYSLDGREVSYLVQGKDESAKKAVEYFRVNPHRLQLGQIGMELFKKDGTKATIADLKNIQQQLDLWTGLLYSCFTLDGDTVKVITAVHPNKDELGFEVQSGLLASGRLNIWIRFPYPTGQFKDVGHFFGNAARHRSTLSGHKKNWNIQRVLDTTVYNLSLQSSFNINIVERAAHEFVLTGAHKDKLTLTVSFGHQPVLNAAFESLIEYAKKDWQKFWMSGAVVDFTGSTDTRAFELERRVVLSQYLTKIQCTSSNPPQETGLTYNSWYGKPHIEMHWWHAVHFAQWGRPEWLAQSMNWYFKTQDLARDIAKRQGYKGLRWQKMTDNDGAETPSSVGAFLIWQQPHFIFMAEQLYQADPSKSILDKYKDLLFETAEFMADFPQWDTAHHVFHLGKGLIPAQECFDALDTYNPTYELAYWSWALQTAQQWRLRAGLPRKAEWDLIIQKLAPLPQKDGVYLAAESTPDCYVRTRYISDHPAVLGALGMLPIVHGMDTAVMSRTFELVKKIWNWDDTWGWDYPMMAMTAARLGRGDWAVDALLMPVQKNTYLPNGHNYQDGRLTIYLPGNGGLLSAIALMCTGNAPGNPNAGFPKDGSWTVRWEGFKTMF